jgi:hypothetical protein
MSAVEPGLMAQLVAEPTLAEKALRRIVTLFAENDRMSCHELRVLEIVLEGLNVPAGFRRKQIEGAIQRRRDRVEAVRAARQGAADENP